MARTPFQNQKIQEALSAKLRACPACGWENYWFVYDNYNLLRMWETPTTMLEPDRLIPCIVTGCMNCGLTQLHNVHILGIASILGIPGPKEAM